MNAETLTPLLPLAVAFIGGYSLGAVPFGLLLTRIAGLGDIRAMGSGNIGATNVLRTGRKGIAAATLLLDAPPAEKEVEFRLDVRMPPRSTKPWRSLESLSPVVRALAHEQFDDLVKQVRLFAAPDEAAAIQNSDGLEELLLEAVRDACV